MTATVDSAPVRLRLSRRQRAFWLVVAGVDLGFSAFFFVVVPLRLPGAWLWLVLAALNIGVFGMLGRLGVDLPPDQAIARGLRRRTILRRDVTAVEVQRRGSADVVVLVEVSGRTRLRAPVDGPMQRNPQFSLMVAAIQGWSLSHPVPVAINAAPAPARLTVWRLMQLVLSAFLVLYGALTVILASVLGPALLPAALVAFALACLLEPLRPRVRGLLARAGATVGR